MALAVACYPVFRVASQVGFPSVGKSSLLTKLTGTASEVAAYEFTTLTCIPGTINYRGSRIQLLDMPVRRGIHLLFWPVPHGTYFLLFCQGIIEGAKDGKGRGRQVIGTARCVGLPQPVAQLSRR